MMINGSYQIGRRLQRHIIYTVSDNDKAALAIILGAIAGSHEVDLLDFEPSTDLSLIRERKP